MLHNSLMASALAKAVQVLGATLSLQKTKLVLTSQPLESQPDDPTCSISSICNSTVLTTGSSTKQQEEDICEDAPRAVVTQSYSVAESTEPKLISIKSEFPEISNPKPLNLPLIVRWGQDEDIQVQHHKQTSSQLLHFLKTKGKNMDSLESSVMEWSKITYSKHLSQPVSPTAVNAQAPTTLDINIENQAPIFRVKKVESSSCLVYTFVIATETELWDIGDIFTDVVQDSQSSALEGRDCQDRTAQAENTYVNIPPKPQALQYTTAAEQENNNHDANVPTCIARNIPEFQIQKFEETEIVVSHIVSPSHFYVQRADCFKKLQALVAE